MMHAILVLTALSGASFSPPVLPPAGLSARSQAAASDSARIVRDARRAQEEFERFRETRIPAELQGRGGRCDEPVGRLCLVYGDGNPSPIVGAPRPVVEARAELLDQLAAAAAELPGDEWILGQRVRYLLEDGDRIGAREALRECHARAWWCSVLSGTVLHEEGAWVAAGEAFLDGLEAMPDAERERWTGEQWVLERDGRAFVDDGGPTERERRRALLWRLADPLFLVPGNDRWTEHMSRLTQVRLLEDAWNPFGLPWDEDLEQILLRYGWALGWERGRSLPDMNPRQIQENRMIARLDPDRRRYLPTGEALEAFPATGEGALDVGDAREEKSGYSPSYAPRIENLESQTARFLREGRLFVVHAFAPRSEAVVAEAGVAAAPRDPFGPPMRGDSGDEASGEPPPGDLRTALFVLPVWGPVIEDGPRPAREGDGLEGVWTTTVDRGDHILSLEAWSRLDGRAWRSRRGLPDLPGGAGGLEVSDPVLLDPDAGPLPDSLDDALPHVLPRLREPAGGTIRIAWEVYGIPEGGIATVSLGVEPAERGFLRRLGEFFRVIEPPTPVTVRWDDATADADLVFRAIDLQLPDGLDPGAYDLLIEIGLAGDPPAVARTRLEIEDR